MNSTKRSKRPSSNPPPPSVPHWVITIGVIVASVFAGAVISGLRQSSQTASPSVTTPLAQTLPEFPQQSSSSAAPPLWSLKPNALQTKTLQTAPVRKLQSFEQLVRAVDPQGLLIINARQGQPETLLEITVSHFWYEQPYPVRVQMAQNLWRVWSTTSSIANPEQARIRLVDPEGYEVGGSAGFLGSRIYIDRN